LKRSNGSRQVRQRQSALHGVEPKREISSVSVLPQRGQATGASGSARGDGGAIP
jgi:hypothetical protein